MKQFIVTISALLIAFFSFSQANTISYEDSNFYTPQRWRDTCFGLIDKSTAQIPTGYLVDSFKQFSDLEVFTSILLNEHSPPNFNKFWCNKT